MLVKNFLRLVEIQTKLASLFPFLIGISFVIFHYSEVNFTTTLIFFVAMLLFDMTTTAINNYMDYVKASTDHYRKHHNIIGQAQLSTRLVRTIIFTMLAISTGLGIWLVLLTDLFVLLVGMLCFGIGIFYTFGPIPLSRMPLGEVFSGLTMGFGIVFLTVYINAFDQGIVNLLWDEALIRFEANLVLILEIFLVSLPSVLTIFNLMLANNLCDLDEDIENNRFTLPYYIGKKSGIILFNILYILVFIIVIINVLLGLYPPPLLATLLLIYPIYKNVKMFNHKQVKSETFHIVTKNLMLINGSIVILFLISLTFM